jgi:hypothetical protein
MLVTGWISFEALSKTCAASGYVLVNRGYAVQPTVREACRSLAESLALANSPQYKSAKLAENGPLIEQFVAIANRTVFNGFNSHDEKFSYETYQFSIPFESAISVHPEPGAISHLESAGMVMQQDCQSRGFWPKLATV